MARQKKPVEKLFPKVKFTIPPELYRWLVTAHSDNKSGAVAEGLELLRRHEAGECPCLLEKQKPD